MSTNSNVSHWKYSNLLNNQNNRFNKEEILKILSAKDIDESYNTISKWKNYKQV